MESKEKINIGWVDMLRVIACFMVVVSHCCDGFVAQFDADRDSFLTGVFMGSLMRPCVPLFAMMTGVLLLPIKSEYSLTGFYCKRLGRLVPSIVFWSLLLPILAYIYFVYISPNTANPSVTVANYTITSLVEKLYTFVFNFNFDTVPMWYLYMLIGLYLIIPILNSWLVQASRQDIKTILYIWGITMFLPYVKMIAPMVGYHGNYGNINLLGECDWNIYGTFYYFSGFAGYLILAYYLVKYPLTWSWKKTWLIAVPTFLIGYAITSFGFVFMQSYFPGNYAYLEIIWFFTGINVFMMTFSVFIVIQKMDIPTITWLSRLASLSFGIYLCHYTFIFVTYDLFNVPSLPYIVRIVLMAFTTFAISFLVAYFMSKFKFTNRFVR